jgi:starvation-inducible DNA-binding protein
VSEIPTRSDLLPVHEIVFKEARAMAGVAAEAGDDGTNDVIVSDVVPRSQWRVWFVAGHRSRIARKST